MRIFLSNGIVSVFLAGQIFLLFGCGIVSRRALEQPVQPVQLDVVYPRLEEGDSIFVVPRVDSTFALGSVRPAAAEVFVNGVPAEVWENGAFLAFFPLDTLNGQYNFLAVGRGGDSINTVIPFLFYEDYVLLREEAEPEVVIPPLPVCLKINNANAVLRTGPDLGYWLFPPSGCAALADSFDGSYYRLSLCQGLHAWVEDRFVTLDTSRADPPRSVVDAIFVRDGDEWTQIRIPLEEPLIYRLEERPATGSLVIDLYGAVARVDQINYENQDSSIRHIAWNQVGDDLLRLEIYTNLSRFWGYGATYEGNTLLVKVRRPPEIERRSLKGRVIALDPGHGGSEDGAIGPTRLLEKDANLALASKMKRLLEKEGARVVLTRWSDSTVAIYDRIDCAVSQNAEILLSLHNNALPDGRNPFVERGSSVYYYHPQSRDLAWALHKELLKASGLRDQGFFYKNLALARPTQLPAVLIECAFIIHPEEEMLLRDDRFLDRLAKGLVKGLKNYLKECQEIEQYGNPDYFRQRNIIKKPLWNPIIPDRQHD